MAKIAELEAQLPKALQKPIGPKAVKAVLMDPPYRSDSALPHLSLALWNLAAAAQRTDLAFLEKASKKTKTAWPDTWMRRWLIESMASTSALILRVLDGPSKPATIVLPTKPRPRWLATSGTHDFAKLDGLLNDLLDGAATQIAERASALLGWPKDARIAKAAVAAHRGRLVSNAMHPIWNALGNAIAVHSDEAVREELAHEMVEDPTLAGPYWVSHWKGGLDPAPRKAAVKERGPPKTAEEFEAWVMAAPGDLGRRAAWADWLLEQGNPRGELMSLQLADRALTAAEEKKVAALVKKHGKEWIGKLRGVLVGMRVDPVADWGVAEEPGWANIEELSVPSQRLSPKLEAKVLGCVPRLRVFDGPSLELLRKALGLDTSKLERLGFDYGFHAETISAPDAAMFKAAKVPALRALRVAGQPKALVLKQLMGMPWFGGLERLTVTGHGFDERFGQVASSKLPRIDVLSYSSQGWEPGPGVSFSATRVVAKWRLEVTGLPDPTRSGSADYFHEAELLPVLGRLPARTFTEVTLEIQKASPKVAKKIEAQVKRICG